MTTQGLLDPQSRLKNRQKPRNSFPSSSKDTHFCHTRQTTAIFSPTYNSLVSCYGWINWFVPTTKRSHPFLMHAVLSRTFGAWLFMPDHQIPHSRIIFHILFLVSKTNKLLIFNFVYHNIFMKGKVGNFINIDKNAYFYI